jgi:alkyl sulfatase BDS1-like metallo-beta-lactamase superfamily hydrolase
MPDDLLALSADMIDRRVLSTFPNRITNELSEVADGIAMVESFSHVVLLRTDDGLLAFDTSGAATGTAVVEALRGWAPERVHTVVYTHGHADHVAGSGAFLSDATGRGYAPPAVVGHEAVPARFARYREMNGWNIRINTRQFGGVARVAGLGIGGAWRSFLPEDTLECTEVYRDRHTIEVGGLAVELHHGRGETDDHTWAWVPSRRAVCTGDFVTWVFPNAGNPQKVQRYPLEWAAALREIAALAPELLLPAHGLPIAGAARIAGVLDDIASVLERLVADVVALMNEGATLDDVIHTVRVDERMLGLPYLMPVYDEPEFVVRNVWRLYGGWWDGNPARLKPPRDADVARELAALAGTGALVARAEALAGGGDLRLACELVEIAAAAAPDDAGVHRTRAAIYRARRDAETSLMAKGVYADAARASDERLAAGG